jgi:uncharacterized membrane protein
VRRKQAQGSWLDTHFQWLWRTFWWMLAGLAAATVAFGPILTILTRVPLLEIGYLAVGLWAAWRLGRGWQALRTGRPVRIGDTA